MDQQRKSYEQGLVLMKYKRYDDALSLFEYALECATSDTAAAEAWFQIGCCRSEIAKQKIESAEERFNAVEEFELYEGAIDAYKNTLNLQRDYTSARKILAELFTYFGEMQSEADKDDLSDWMQAIEWYKQAIEVYPGLTDSYYKLSEAYEFLMDDKSIHDWDDEDVLDQTGMMTVDIVGAHIETYQKLTEIQPDDAKTFYELGKAYRDSINPYITLSKDYGNETQDEIEAMEQGKHPQIRTILEKSIQAYQTAIKIKPHYAEAFHALGEVCHRLGQFEEAIQAFKQAIVLDNKGRNNLARVYHQLGKQNFADGNYMRAIECYNNAIVTALKDDHNEMYYDLAVAYHDAGRYELAIWAYRRVKGAYSYPSDLFRRYPDLLYRLGTACHKCSCYQDAVDAYREAIDYQTAMEEEYYQIDLENCKDEYHKIHSSNPFEYPEFDYPEWWEDVYQNLESASRNEPL